MPVGEAADRVLAVVVVADRDDPHFDNSAMDGWAVHAEDGDAGTTLTAAGAVHAGGDVSEVVVPRGCATRIMTGAEMPRGAALIAPVETVETTEDANGEAISIRLLEPAGDHVRRRGENFIAGDELLPVGSRLTAARLALCVTAGAADLQVQSRLEIAILPSGDELMPAGTPLGPGQLHESNSLALACMVERLGHLARVLPIVGDDPDATRRALDSAADSDVILTSGGVSMGEADHIRGLMERQGEVDFWRIRIKPGGPVMFGAWNGTPLFGLPGNPVSTQVVFTVLVAPWLAAAQGAGTDDSSFTARRVPVVVDEPFRAAIGKRTFPRVTILNDGQRLIARAATHQGSGNALSMGIADALLDLPADAELAVGDVATALLFD